MVRALLIAGLSVGMLGFVLSLMGMECTHIGGKDRSKHKKIYTGGWCHVIGGKQTQTSTCPNGREQERFCHDMLFKQRCDAHILVSLLEHNRKISTICTHYLIKYPNVRKVLLSLQKAIPKEGSEEGSRCLVKKSFRSLNSNIFVKSHRGFYW